MITEPIEIGFDKLPEARDWKVGDTYRVKLVVKQVAMDAQSAMFEIVDATSMEAVDKAHNLLLSDEGMYMGK